MASISGASSSLGNTSLRGFGGFASGIDRDAIIEQMTMGTNTKITNKKSDITSLQWKQEAYQSVSGQILDLMDNYFSYASGKNLKSSTTFGRNQVTTLGDPDVTKYITATGTSSMTDYLSILGVSQLASAATRKSNELGSKDSLITTNIDKDWSTKKNEVSTLKGTKLVFGQMLTESEGGGFKTNGTFTFPDTYLDEHNKAQPIDYTAAPEILVDQLNKATKNFTLGDTGKLEFVYTGTPATPVPPGTPAPTVVPGKISIKITGLDNDQLKGYQISTTRSAGALAALGFKKPETLADQECVSIDQFNDNTSKQNAGGYSYVAYQDMAPYLADKDFTITYGGQTKTVKLLKTSDLDKIGKEGDKYLLDDKEGAKGLASIMQDNLNKAFGTDKIKVDTSTGNLAFQSVTKDAAGKVTVGGPSLTIAANDAQLMKNLGIDKINSSQLSLNASIKENLDAGRLNSFTEEYKDGSATEYKFEINGVQIDGITADTTINDMIKKINANEEAGVKATYLDSTNQFVLIASETGTGREIKLGGVAAGMFAGKAEDNKDGTDAVMEVSYGNGVNTTITSSTNSFNLEGLKVTATGTFGYKLDADGKPVNDTSQAVTFSASADVDGVTETVKKFIEEYNAMVKEINTQVTSKPDKSYGPLTEEQKEEMSETSIENWEKKAKQGLLFNDSVMRDLSMDMQGVMSKMLSSGISYKDLESIGITMSEDYKDGGTLVFDENKFKEAMNSDPELVSDIFTGGNGVSKGLSQILDDTLSNYATRYGAQHGNSNGRLIEAAGSDKIPSSLTNNEIYKLLQNMQEELKKLQSQLSTEQDRYISQFTTMETVIGQMNSQSSYLSSLSS